MTQQIIITTPINSGDGTPIANAFTYCNDNFSELYSRAQSTPPVTLTGSIGDTAGMYAYDSAAWYYCFADYDGSTDIWATIPESPETPARIANGNSSVNIASANSNVVVSVNSNTVSTFTSTGQQVVGTISATGNITTDSYFVGNFSGNISGNLVVPGLDTEVLYNNSGNAGASAGLTFNYTSNVLTTSGSVTATGNIVGGNINTAGLVSATGNVTGGNIRTAGLISATGNITGGNVRTAGQVSATGNVTGGNILSVGIVSSLGNISGNYLIGDGSLITNLPAGNYSNANVAAYLPTYTGNVSADNFLLTPIGGLINDSNVVSFVANVDSTATAGINLYPSTGVILSEADSEIAFNIQNVLAANITSSGFFSEGNISTSGNFIGAGLFSVASVNTGIDLTATDIEVFGANNAIMSAGNSSIFMENASVGISAASGAVSITANSDGSALQWIFSGTGTGNLTFPSGANLVTTGNVYAGVLSVNSGNVDTAIINAGGNGYGNIGSSSTYFNTVFATATTALYADLAECYLADAEYAPGTVLCFAGTAEVTQCDTDACATIAGVVSTRPAYQMNSGLTGDHVVSMALMGRVPCAVQGPIARGDMLVSAGNGRARAEKNPAMGTVIGKALESFDGDVGTIEIVVGRL